MWKVFISLYAASGSNVYKAAKAIRFPSSTMYDYVQRCEETDDWGMPAVKYRGRTAPPKIKERHGLFIENLLERRGEITLRELGLELQDAYPEDFAAVISNTALHTYIKEKLLFTLKLAEVYPARRNSPDIRANTTAQLNVLMRQKMLQLSQNLSHNDVVLKPPKSQNRLAGKCFFEAFFWLHCSFLCFKEA